MLTKRCYAEQCNLQGTAVCTQTWNNRTCKCNSKFEGEICDKDINECEVAKNTICKEPTRPKCVNLVGGVNGYICNCTGNFNFCDQESFSDKYRAI